MVKFRRYVIIECLVVFMTLLTVLGCAQPGIKGTETSSNNIKKIPDQITKIKVGLPAQTIDYLPWYLADKKGIFKKYNLEVQFTQIEGGVIGQRGMQTGDLQFSATLADPVITGVSEGSSIKLIGALTTQSMFSVIVTPEIQKVEDLRGKTAAVLSPGNGTDLLMRWWLKQHGLEPDKDVLIIAAGGNPARVEALRKGQAQVTLLSPPTDLSALVAGLKRLTYIRDELKNFNHDVIAASSKYLKEKPEVARAFMGATVEAIDFIKNENNRKEVTQIGMQVLQVNEDDFTKTLNFAIPSYSNRGKLNDETLKTAIDIVKQSGNLKKDVSLSDIVDESYYGQ